MELFVFLPHQAEMLRSDVARCVSPRAHIKMHLIVAPPDKALYQSSEHLRKVKL